MGLYKEAEVIDMRVKRSKNQGMKVTDSKSDRTTPENTHPKGVGARHRQTHPAAQGVGYLDNCNKTQTLPLGEKLRDPRIEELREEGISWQWIAIADAIGYDNFIMMWRMVSGFDHNPYSSMVRIFIPHSRKLDKIQRNRFIATMSRENKSTDEIMERLKNELNCGLKRKQICRIIDAQNKRVTT